MGRQQRQRPISCHFCRVRKLRCSRQFPCSNCTSRGVSCQQGPDAAPSATPATQQQQPVANGALAPDVLSRLEKLEALVASQGKELEVRRQSAYPVPRPSIASSAPSPMPSKLQRLTAEALWLEETCTGYKSVALLISDSITFRSCPMRLATKQSSFIFQNSSSLPSTAPLNPTKCIWLPLRHEAEILVRKFIDGISHFHPVVLPSVWPTIDKLYDAVDSAEPVDWGVMILLLSICASVTFSWTDFDQEMKSLFANSAESHGQFSSWLKGALDIIDHAERLIYASIESIQGLIILFFVTCNAEGISQRARALVSRATTMARELSLHRIDYTPPSGLSNASKMSEAQAEMGRRVWWYLVATDWMMAQFYNPSESTYTIHPEHMVVNKPRNIRDEDLVEGRELIEQPLDEPTDVMYLLQRIRLADTCRQLLDRSPLALLNPESLDYQHVLEIDDKLKNFKNGIPAVLQLDFPASEYLPSVDRRTLAGIMVQRYSLNLILLRQRCKLHLPYLARSVVEPEFAHSRRVCLESAKGIIRIERDLKLEDLPLMSSRLRIMIILRSVFLATIVMVLDACLKSGSGESSDTEEEVADAWEILEEAQDQSPTAGRLLDLSMQVLRRHNVAHPALETIKHRRSTTEVLPPQTGPLPMTPESAYRNDQGMMGAPQYGGSELETAYLERQWHALEGRMDLDAIDWDKLFGGLDAPFI